jgi:pyruvate dehydrogenase E1 component alpha subunit
MLDIAKRKAMLRQMILLRAFEEKLEELYQRKAMFGSTHSYRGQEAIAVGVCSALERTDLIASYHRGTGHLIAKGADLYTLLCECMGREDGYSKGRGGKMHMGDMAFGFLGNTGTVGGTVPTATGAALSAKIRGSQEVVASFFGDGAANQGVVHESMNLAGVWKLPVIYVCENNQYAMTVSFEHSVAIKHLSERGAAYGFEGKTIDGNDVEAVYNATAAAAIEGRNRSLEAEVSDQAAQGKAHSGRSIDRGGIRKDLVLGLRRAGRSRQTRRSGAAAEQSGRFDQHLCADRGGPWLIQRLSNPRAR